MKKTIVSILLLTVVNAGVNAQSLREKIAAKKAALEAKMAENAKAGSSSLDANVSQSDMAMKWEDKEYDKYLQNVRKPENKGVKVRIDKKDGQVNSIWLGTMEYKADEYGKSKFVRYYKTTGGGHFRVVFFEDKIVVFKTDGSGKSRAKYFLNKPGKYDDVVAAGNFVKESQPNQQAELDLYASNQKANAEKDYKAKEAIWSIKGKKVTKIEVTDIKAAHSFGYYRPFSFQIKATLANGKTISTKDGGFWTDYKVTFKNGDVKNNTIQDTRFIEGDKIVVEVKSKFDSKIKATGDVVMDYSESLNMNNNSNNWAENAANYTAEVKQMKHAITGKPILLFKVTDHSGYQKTLYFKMDANKTLNFFANGHRGKEVAGNNSSGSGENGGNITIIKDPSVKIFNINYTNTGGTGGAGTYGYNRGRDGRDGKYKEEVRAVSF